MLGALFALLVAGSFAVYYILVERPRQRALEVSGPHPRPLPLTKILATLPRGVFLHPTFTWGRLRPNGDVDLGIHPLLLGLVGESSVVDANPGLGRIEKGGPIARIIAGGRELVVRSPAGGRIVATNPRVDAHASWCGAAGDDGSWVCRVRPDGLSDWIANGLISDRAVEWTRRRYGDIRDHVLALTFRGEPDVLLADGGEIPIGILGQLDAVAWHQFDQDFLAATS